MEAGTQDPPTAAVKHTAAMPPRPDLSNFMMSMGFMLMPTRFMDECRKRCGDYFTLRPMPDRELVVTADPAAVKKVFTGDPNLLYAGEGNVTLAPILGSASVLLLDGDEHMRQRKLLLPPFHGERMRSYGTLMEEVAERHIAEWPRSRRFAVLPSMQAITLEIIMRAVFGFDDDERRERIGGPLRRLLDMVASRPRVVLMALTREPQRAAQPVAAVRGGAGASRRSCSTRRSALAAPTRTAPTATTSSRCCSKRGTPTASRSATSSSATS